MSRRQRDAAVDDVNLLHPVGAETVQGALSKAEKIPALDRVMKTDRKTHVDNRPAAISPAKITPVIKINKEMYSPRKRTAHDSQSQESESPVIRDISEIRTPQLQESEPPVIGDISKTQKKTPPASKKNSPNSRKSTPQGSAKSSPHKSPSNSGKARLSPRSSSNSAVVKRHEPNKSPFALHEQLEENKEEVVDPRRTNANIRFIRVVYIKGDDGYYRRAGRESEETLGVMEEEDDLPTEQEMMAAAVRYIDDAFLNNTDLVGDTNFLRIKDYKDVKRKGYKPTQRYANYVAKVLNNKDKRFILSLFIDIFYTACCMGMELFLDVQMKDHFEKLKSKTDMYGDILLANPTINRLSGKMIGKTRSTNPYEVSLWGVGIMATVQLIGSFGIAYTIKKANHIVATAAGAGVGIAEDALEGYLFKGKGLMESFKPIMQMLSKYVNNNKNYKNEGEVDTEPIVMEMDDPDEE